MSLNHRVLWLLVVTSTWATSLRAAERESSKPDVLFLMPDQMRGDCLSILGHSGVRTPHLDELAKDGVLFRRAYSTVPSCIPARHALLTGLYPQTSGVVGYFAKPISTPTLPGELAKAGYTTVLVGRNMHQVPAAGSCGYQRQILGSTYVEDDEYDRFLQAAAPSSKGIKKLVQTAGLTYNGWQAAPWPLREDLHPTAWIVRESRRIVAETASSGPLFLTASFYSPHPPLFPPKRLFDAVLTRNLPPAARGDWVDWNSVPANPANRQSDRVRLEGDKLRQTQAGYFGLIDHIDEQISPLVADFKARSEKAGRPWIIVVSSDHGEMLGDHGYFRKCEPYEGSANIPLIFAASPELGFKPGTRSQRPVCLEDIMPTLLELCGVQRPTGLDGVSLVPVLRGGHPLLREWLHFEHSACYSQEQAFQALTDGLYKYIWRPLDGREQLFDLEHDPREEHDLSADPAQRETLQAWRIRLVKRLACRPEGFSAGENLIPGRERAKPDSRAKTPRPKHQAKDEDMGRETRTIAGWKVHVSRRLLTEQKAETDKALALLQKQLEEILRVVPKSAVAELQKVPLWFSPEYAGVRPTAEYHPDAQWLREHGRPAAMAKGVEFTNVRLFEAETKRMPNFALHELAHAYHDRILGFENADIRAAYDRAKASKSYDAVERWHGPGRPKTKERAYAMTDPKEYFAETTEAFFSRNDFHPFTRDELAKHDPEMFTLLTRLWGVPSDGKTPWNRHVIDDSSRGADGVRLADVNGDGLLDIATGWEEGGAVRLYLNPGPAKAEGKWPAVTVGRVGDVEDAVFADLDGDGAADVVSCCEGKTRSIFVHWAPRERSSYLDKQAWQTEPLPASAGAMMWMFALPLQLDGKHGLDLVAGGKGPAAAIGWFEAPAAPRRLADWQWHPLRKCGWLMSLVASDMDGDGDQDVLFTDRKGKSSGAYWLENPGPGDALSQPWTEHTIGGVGKEVMFLQPVDLDQDGLEDVLVAVKPRQIMWLRRLDRSGDRWEPHSILMPETAGTAKGLNAADLNGDGKLDVVFSCEGAEPPRQGLMWLSCDGLPTAGQWTPRILGGADGIKHDLVAVVDLNGDHRPDVITTEERAGEKGRGLGVIWYENPLAPLPDR